MTIDNATRDERTAFPSETTEQRDARIWREMSVIARAEANIDLGLGIEDDDLEAWLDRLDHDPAAPVPAARACRHS